MTSEEIIDKNVIDFIKRGCYATEEELDKLGKKIDELRLETLPYKEKYIMTRREYERLLKNNGKVKGTSEEST